MKRLGFCLALGLLLVGAPGWAKAKNRHPRPAVTETAAFTPWIAPQAGTAVPLGGGSASARVGLKGGFYDLSGMTGVRELSLAGNALLDFGGTTTRIQVAPGVEYRMPLGDSGLFAYGDLWLGYAHSWTTASVQFLGSVTVNGNAFVARVGLGVGYRLADWLSVTLEPIDVAVYAGSGASFEYGPVAALAISL